TPPTLRLRLVLHLAACMPLGFARHPPEREVSPGAPSLGAARRQKNHRWQHAAMAFLKRFVPDSGAGFWLFVAHGKGDQAQHDAENTPTDCHPSHETQTYCNEHARKGVVSQPGRFLGNKK